MELRADPSPLAPLALAASHRYLRLPSLAPSLPALPVMIRSVAQRPSAPPPSGPPSGSPSAPASSPSSAPGSGVPPTPAEGSSPTRAAISFLLNPSPPAALAGPTPPPTLEAPRKKRKTRVCKADGCGKYVVDRGLCIRHGGGKRCSVDGCNCRAQNRGLCWKHGGYTQCTVEGCAKRAKSRGICWSHGGGTRCKHAGCAKIAVSHGLCWAHGGGKRCRVPSCQKPAYERNGNLCAEHCGSPSLLLPDASDAVVPGVPVLA